MRVLIVDEDVFATKGGGQTVYRKLIRDHPDISFVYFTDLEAHDTPRPPNASVVQLAPEPDVTVADPLFFPASHLAALRRAIRYAITVKDRHFHVVDAPDYKLFGPFLSDALIACNVQFGGLAHALHGALSDSIRLDWASKGEPPTDLRDLELGQFENADVRYGISQGYANEWRARSAAEVTLLDPCSVLERPTATPARQNGAKPELLCVGRRERRKGNDLAIEMVAWLDPTLHRGLRHIGPASPAGPDQSGDVILEQMAINRGVPWTVQAALSPQDLQTLYRGAAIVIAPVRYDTFNLVALEALAAGAPLVISRRAMVCDYLEALDPPPPILAIDPDRLDEAAHQVEEWLRDYPAIRSRTEAYASIFRDRIRELDIRPVYQAALGQAKARGGGLPKFNFSAPSRRPNNLIQRGLRAAARHEVAAKAYRKAKRGVIGLLGGALSPNSDDVRSLASALRPMPERSASDIAQKISLARLLSGHAAGRCTLWAELARLERLRGENLRAASYDLRVMRLVGGDSLSKLPDILKTLSEHGLSHISPILSAQYDAAAPDGALASLLEDRQAHLRLRPPMDYIQSRSFDRRDTGFRPRVSVLVSLYDTGSKLKRFVELILRQTLAKRNELEFVFIDAASPTDEWRLLSEAMDGRSASYCYVRIDRRITIQAAWNEALEHARGDYIACLGVDETLYPTGLEELADMLDRDPAVDWAMASSLLTDVNARGGLIEDKMLYDRHDAHRDMAFLDTTYVSWVGGVYRRSIHERYGFYDPAFRAAGDTEFKMRVLPHLKVAFHPRTLGLFLDYPEARATGGVLAEIEDSLAWYAHRTPAGAARLFAIASTSDLIQMLSWCAGRRKCYSTTLSTDVELGAAAAGILAGRRDAPPYAADAAVLLCAMRDELRIYDWVAESRAPMAARTLQAQWKGHRARFEALTGLRSSFSGLNDNRFQQHAWLWETSG